MLAGDIRRRSNEMLLAIEGKKAPGETPSCRDLQGGHIRLGESPPTSDGLHRQALDLWETRLAAEPGLWRW